MTDESTPAGWYPDGQGQSRWWDGSRWTERVQDDTAASPVPGGASSARENPVIRTSTAARSTQGAFYTTKWFVAAVAVVVGLMVGAVTASGADVKDSSEYKTLADDATSLKADRDEAVAAKDALTDEMEPLKASVAAVDTRQAELDDREKATASAAKDLAKKVKAVAKREKAVGIVETEIKNNTIDGDGIYAVGDDIAAGTYKTKGGSACYYAVLRDTKGGLDSIVTNNNISGPGIVSVANGQFLELSGCDEWTKR